MAQICKCVECGKEYKVGMGIFEDWGNTELCRECFSKGISVKRPEQNAPTQQNPLYGVKGWLNLFVIGNLYIAPVLFVLQYIIAWLGFIILAEHHPGIIPIGLLETGVKAFLVWKWIQIARQLRDIQPGVVQKTKTWLGITLAWGILSTLLTLPVLATGMNVDDLLIEASKGIVTSLIVFGIWYSYFGGSKRVKATYPDWNK